MEDLSLHILDIAENSIRAGANTIEISVVEDSARDTLTIEIVDDGKGMDAESAKVAAEAFYTTRTTRRVGLGLALLKEASEQANGSLGLETSPEGGTKVVAVFQLSHIDRKPLGNIPQTILSLLMNDANVEVQYSHRRDHRSFVFDSRDFRADQHGMSTTSTPSLREIRELLTSEETTLINGT